MGRALKNVFFTGGAALASAVLEITPATAQEVPAPSPHPLVGVSSTSVSAATANRERVTIAPSLAITYDSNVLRRDADSVAGGTDNVRTTPAINLSYNRQIGRTQFRLSAGAGYDFNSRFRYLDRQRISARAELNMPVGSRCPFGFRVSHDQAQYDLIDLEQVIGSVQTLTEVSGDITCSRPGLSPNFGASYRGVRNSRYNYGDSDYREMHSGLTLTLPSLGTAALNGQLAELRRPNVKEITGTDDSTSIRRVYLALNRSVAPRLRLAGNVGYVQASPRRAAVPTFKGLSYQVEGRYSFTPRIRLNLTASNDVQNSSGVSATYMVREELRALLNIDVLNRTTLSFGAYQVDRRFEGNDLVAGVPLSGDSAKGVNLQIQREIGRRFRLGLTGGFVLRDAEEDLYDFEATSISLNLSSKF